MNYQEVMDYLYQSLPMFHRVGPAAYNRSLDKTLELLEYLGNPHQNLQTIHIAGTNGKGSVSSMLSSILTQAGYRTGLYTSPHLIDFRERIRVNGVPVPVEFVVEWINQHQPTLDSLKPSFFETTVGMCFDYFKQVGTEYAVIETGLGGRIDSTNVIHPLVSIITNISWDHADLLGDTLEAIAGEKAGIIKKGIPIISGTSAPEIISVFESVARQNQSPLSIADQIWKMESREPGPDTIFYRFVHLPSGERLELESDLLGDYQQENIGTVLTAVLELRKLGITLSREIISDALRQVRKLSGLRGRMELLGKSPQVLADTAHNEAGIAMVMQQISRMPHTRMWMVWGMVSDKDRSKIFPLLPKDAGYFFVKPDLPRALDTEKLAEEAQAWGLSGTVCESVWAGYQAALQASAPEDLIFIGGSTYVVGELLRQLP